MAASRWILSTNVKRPQTLPGPRAFSRFRDLVSGGAHMNQDAFVSRAQAAMVTGVRPDTIGKWLARGWVDLTGERHKLTTKPAADGRSLLYRLGDILAAERDTRLNPRARRRPPRILAF
jgi:hypothetical protein